MFMVDESLYLQDPSFGTLALESADSVDAAPSPTRSTPSATIAHLIVHVVNIVVAARFHHIAV